MADVFNIDESPINRDWLHTKWTLPIYRSEAFFKRIRELGIHLASFKQGAMYKAAVAEGVIVNDEWVPKKDRKK